MFIVSELTLTKMLIEAATKGLVKGWIKDCTDYPAETIAFDTLLEYRISGELG